MSGCGAVRRDDFGDGGASGEKKQQKTGRHHIGLAESGLDKMMSFFHRGRRCHQMPTMPSRKFYSFFDLSLTAPTASIRSPPSIGAADQILCGLLQDIGARRLYGFPVDVRAIFPPNDDIVVK